MNNGKNSLSITTIKIGDDNNLFKKNAIQSDKQAGKQQNNQAFNNQTQTLCNVRTHQTRDQKKTKTKRTATTTRTTMTTMTTMKFETLKDDEKYRDRRRVVLFLKWT